MRIEYVKEVGSHKPGTVITAGEIYGKKMIDKGFAKLSHSKPKPPKKNPKSLEFTVEQVGKNISEMSHKDAAKYTDGDTRDGIQELLTDKKKSEKKDTPGKKDKKDKKSDDSGNKETDSK